MNGMQPPHGPPGGLAPQTDPYRSPAPGPPQPRGSDGKAIAGMVLGIVAAVLSCLPFVGPVCGTIAIVMYVKFNKAFQESGEQLGGKGMAVAGLVTGIIGAAFGLLWTIYYMFWVVIFGGAASGLLWK